MLYGVSPQALRNAASNRPWWDVVYYYVGSRKLTAYDVDEVQDFVWGLEKKEEKKEKVQKCLGLDCKANALPRRHFCKNCDDYRKKHSDGRQSGTPDPTEDR